LATLSELEELNLGRTRSPTRLKHLAGLKKLRRLDLTDAAVAGGSELALTA